MSDRFSPHEAWEDLAAAFALDALDEADARRFEAHLLECDRCRREVEEMREAAGLLAYAAPPAAPPPGLRARVLAEATARPAAAAPVEPPEAPPAIPLRPARSPARWAPRLALAASVLLALVAGWGYVQERDARLALRAEYEASRAALAEREALLATLLSPDIQTVRLSATDQAPSVRLFLNRQRGLVVLTAANLPPAGQGRTYQLWGIPAGGEPVSIGTFDTSRQGRAQVVLEWEGEVPLALSAVTEEPAGGSPQPTSTPFLVGEWEAAE